jgi:hypothetical protein
MRSVAAGAALFAAGVAVGVWVMQPGEAQPRVPASGSITPACT